MSVDLIRILQRAVVAMLFLVATLAAPTTPSQSQIGYTLSVPLVMRRWPPIPGSLPLAAIDNTDLDNSFSLSWGESEDHVGYVIQQDSRPDFLTATTTWADGTTTRVYVNQIPGTHYFRVAGYNGYGVGPWSNTQAVTIYPLFLGLRVRWDGTGFIRTDETFDVGSHGEYSLDLRTDVDILRSSNRHWYSPDPKGWGEATWQTYYRASTGDWVSSSGTGSSDWKWGYGWYTAYGSSFSGGIAYIDDQYFTVTGPHSGFTAFGVAMQYWEMKNRDRILYWDNGSGWAQYCEPNTITFRYDAGPSRLLLHSDILRRYYQNGTATGYTIRYVDNLTYASFFNGVIGVPDLMPLAGSLPQAQSEALPNFPDGPGWAQRLP